MSTEVNVEDTAEVIDGMVRECEARAEELRRIAAQMRKSGELTYSAEAVNVIKNLMANIRIDLLIVRPLRALGLK